MFGVGCVPTYNQSVGKRYDFWTALERVVKEVPDHEQLFVLMDANARTGRRGGGKLGSEEYKVLGAYGRDMLNDNGERLLSFSANHVLALLNTVRFSVPPRTQFRIRSTSEAKNVLTTFSRGSETENSCGMLPCTPNRHSYPSWITTSSKHMGNCLVASLATDR